MIITPKLGEALLIALDAGHTLVRCASGFHDHGAQFHAEYEGRIPSITRRTANTLVNAGLADYNDRKIPSSLTLTPKGLDTALEHAQKAFERMGVAA